MDLGNWGASEPPVVPFLGHDIALRICLESNLYFVVTLDHHTSQRQNTFKAKRSPGNTSVYYDDRPEDVLGSTMLGCEIRQLLICSCILM